MSRISINYKEPVLGRTATAEGEIDDLGANAQYERHRITGAGNTTATGEISAVKAVGGSVIYDDGCVALVGDAPLEDEEVIEGDIDFWACSTVKIKTGTAYVYGRNITVSA
jgi:hypothetical protein